MVHPTNCACPDSSPAVTPRRKAADCTCYQGERVASYLVAQARGVTGTQGELAAAAGVCRSRWLAWESTDEPSTINLGRILTAAYTSDASKRFALELLDQVKQHIEREAGEPQGVSLARLVDCMHAGVGEVSIAWREANADGVVTEGERQELRTKLADVMGTMRRLELELVKGADK